MEHGTWSNLFDYLAWLQELGLNCGKNRHQMFNSSLYMDVDYFILAAPSGRTSQLFMTTLTRK